MSDHYNPTPSQIVMYSTEHCSDCRRAKTYFETNNIPFMQVLLEGDEQATQFVADLNSGYHRVPTIVFPDGSKLVEPSWEELKEKFNQ
ncbi:MAG: glutaredoxin family protein [Chloroflexi bacterium]|nr:glutaredoxin family protein [Chloroflexota bacterium]MBI1855972.1 glutaredoxin family protein [Chloroflexota bacterium]MBI3339558.1 glutaredoxin family protein [Chloroflexota bacterium]